MPLIFLIAEDTAGAGMMRGVFVLSLSTLRPLPPSAPTRRAQAKRRRAPEARRRNATPVQRLWRRACQRAGHWALWQWSPAPARRRAPRSATRPFLLVRLRLNSVVTDLRLSWIQGGKRTVYFAAFRIRYSHFCTSTDVLRLGCRLKIRPQWLKFKKMLVLVGLESLSEIPSVQTAPKRDPNTRPDRSKQSYPVQTVAKY